MKINIAGFLEVSTVDYPKHISSVVWMCGCPFRCPMCYNPDVALSKDCVGVEISELMQRIKATTDFNDAVTITGGEPTVQIDALVEVLKASKKLGLKTQINTNGFFPENLKKAIPYLDLVAIDIKTRLVPEEYEEIIGNAQDGKEAISRLKESLQLLKDSDCEVQIRTTVIPGVNDDPEIIKEISEFISWADCYVVKKFTNKVCMDEKFTEINCLSEEEAEKFKKIAEKKIEAFVR